MVAVCFLIALLTTLYAGSTFFLNQFSPGLQTYSVQSGPDASEAMESNFDVIAETLHQFFHVTIFQTPLTEIAEQLIDAYSSNISILFASLRTLNELLLEDFSFPFFMMLLGTFLAILYCFLVENILQVGEARFFLETRTYCKTQVRKIFFLYKLNYIRRPAWVMCCRSIYQQLWNLTIIGGIIKHYEYSMIPYILAENPSINRTDAFLLSRRLMSGNKRRMFLLHLSFIGWYLLSIPTLGVLNFLLLNPYKTATDAELYMELRRNYIRSRSPLYELFNDPLLENELSEDELLIQKALYDDSEGPYTQIAYFTPQQYPAFLYSIQPPIRAVKSAMNPISKYSILDYISLFFIFSVLGWALESFSYLTQNGIFIDRSLLFGPWVPLYGLSGTLTLILCRKFADQPIPVFCLTSLIYSASGYAVNFAADLLWGMAPMESMNYFYDLGLQPIIADAFFLGLVGCTCLYYIAPKSLQKLHKLPGWFRICCCLILGILMGLDLLYTFSV